MEEHDSHTVSMANTPYRNILDTLEGTLVTGDAVRHDRADFLHIIVETKGNQLVFFHKIAHRDALVNQARNRISTLIRARS